MNEIDFQRDYNVRCKRQFFLNTLKFYKTNEGFFVKKTKLLIDSNYGYNCNKNWTSDFNQLC